MSPRSASGSGFRRAHGVRPYVLGHRGARHCLPENTMAAFEGALREGADGVELDVRLTADREVVVIHDLRLERVTAGRDRRSVEALTSADLRRVDVGGGQAPPSLRAVFEWALATRARVNVELKHDGSRTRELVEGVAALVRADPRLYDQVLLSCFHPGVVLRLSRLLPEVPVAWLVHARSRLFRHAPGFRLLGAAGVHPHHELVSAERMVRWRKAGALVNVWTVNHVAQARNFAQLGVDALITDTPGRILDCLG
jgi:glycerophosphoryl diester phosphodiesterase